MFGRVRIAVLAAVAATTALGLTASAPATLWRPQTVTMTITRNGDHAVPMNIAVWPGQPVVLEVRNYSHEFHTFTIPALSMSALIFPAKGSGPRMTTVRFMAQKQHSPVSWLCVICPSGIHGKSHAMAGKVYSMVR